MYFFLWMALVSWFSLIFSGHWVHVPLKYTIYMKGWNFTPYSLSWLNVNCIQHFQMNYFWLKIISLFREVLIPWLVPINSHQIVANLEMVQRYFPTINKNDKGFHYQCFKICEMKEPCHAVIWKNDNLILRNILI